MQRAKVRVRKIIRSRNREAVRVTVKVRLRGAF